MGSSTHRSFERIEPADLRYLVHLACDDFEDLFRRRTGTGIYMGRCALICLCQGAAQHFVHGDRGIQDFDVWAFFRSDASRPFPYRRRGKRDFGLSRFGRNPDDGPGFQGRRVDVIGRSIEIADDESPVAAVQRYLREGKTESARRLAERPVVALWPDAFLGRIIWPLSQSK